MRTEMFLENARWYRGKAFAEFTIRVVQSAKNSRPRRTGLDTRRLLVSHDSVVTPIALVRIAGVGIHETNSVWAGLHAVGAANAELRIDEFDPLRRSDGRVRRTGLIVLERLGAPEMLSVAQQSLLTDPVSANRQKSLRLVELYGGQDSQEVLGQVIAEDQDADIRRKAIIIAGKKQWKGIEPILVDKGLKDPDPDVVLEAARAIVRMGNPDSRPFIHDLMVHSPHSRTREWVVRAVEEAPMALDRDPLIQCLDDPDPDAARHAARALRNLGDPSVAPILREKAMAAREPAIAEEFSAAALHLEVLGQGGDDGI